MRTHIDNIVQYFAGERNIDVSMYDEGYVWKTVQKRMLACGCNDAAEYISLLRLHADEASQLLRQLVNTWTEFFRDPLAFAYLEYVTLPILRDELRNRTPGGIRAWSAGCSTGQEAWSLAVLLEELSAERGERVPYHLFATDNADDALAAARKAVYDISAAGELRLRHVGHLLVRVQDQLHVAPALREHVTIERYDLLDPHSLCPPSCVFGDLDLVLCCNLMMYYRSDIRHIILGKIHRCLSPTGYLMVGNAEREIVLSSGYFKSVCPYIPLFQPYLERS